MKTVKILLRGVSGAGKTGLINQILAECGIRVCGLRTVRHFEKGQQTGYDLTVLSTDEQLSMVRGKPREPGMRPVPGYFDDQARPRLISEAAMDALLLVDEVGRFEKHDTLYLDTLKTLWHSDRSMILVFKKEDLAFNHEIWNEKSDALRIDLDEEGRLSAAQKIIDALMTDRITISDPFLCVRWQTEDFDAAQAGIGRLKAWQHLNIGKGTAFVRSGSASVRAVAADAGLVPAQGKWPELFIRQAATVIPFAEWDVADKIF